jgi:hypothetical protein
MLNNKQKLAFLEVEPVSLRWGKDVIFVKPYLSQRDQLVLAGIYISEYYLDDSPKVDRVYNAEMSLLLGILDLCTNVLMTDDEGKPAFELDNLLANYQFVKSLRESIRNYNEFRATLKLTLDSIALEKNNIGESLSRVADRIVTFLSDFKIDEGTAERLSKLLADANNSEVLKTITEKIK